MFSSKDNSYLSTIFEQGVEDMEPPHSQSKQKHLLLDKLKNHHAQKRSIKASLSLPLQSDEPAEVRAPAPSAAFGAAAFGGFDLKSAVHLDEDDFRSTPGKALARRIRLYLIYARRMASSGKMVAATMIGFVVFLIIASTFDPFGDDCPIVPVYKICRLDKTSDSGRKSCLITQNITEVTEAEKFDYVFERVIGHAVNNQSTLHATLPLYRFHSGQFDHLFTTSETEKNAILDKLPHWTFESKPGDWNLFCSPTPIPNGHDCALVRLVAPEGFHVYASADEELFYYRKMGYTFEKVLCFIKCFRT